MKILKLIMAAGVFILTLFVLNLQAQQTGVTWNPGNVPFGNWNVAGNWGGTVPVAGYKAFFNVTNVGPAVVTDAEGGCQLSLGDGGPGEVIVTNGGTLICGDNTLGTSMNNYGLDTYGWTGIGTGNGAGTMIVDGGTVYFRYHVWLGLSTGGIGTLIVNNGLAAITNTGGAFGIGTSGGTGSVQLNGGTFSINNNIQLPLTNTNQINITMGTLMLAGNATATISTFTNEDKIVAYGGTGTVDIVYNPILNETSVTAVPGISTTNAPSRIISIAVTNFNDVTIVYTTQPTSAYHVESSPSLTDQVWTPIANSVTVATSTNTTFSYTDLLGGTNEFYRVSSP